MDDYIKKHLIQTKKEIVELCNNIFLNEKDLEDDKRFGAAILQKS